MDYALAPMARSCPACRVAMQPLFLEREGEPDVHLDRCAQCGGVWFDAGEAEAVSGRHLAWSSSALGATRKCLGCGDVLTPGKLRGRFEAERCASCHGLWLDEAQLTALGNARLEALAARAARHEERPRPGPTMGFVCAKCTRRAPWSEANGTARGLVCRDCTPKTVDDPSHGRTLLTQTDRFVERLLVAIDEEDGQLPRGSTVLGKPRPVFGTLLDWLLD